MKVIKCRAIFAGSANVTSRFSSSLVCARRHGGVLNEGLVGPKGSFLGIFFENPEFAFTKQNMCL